MNIDKIKNFFKSVESKVNRVNTIEVLLKEISAKRDLLVENYSFLNKALNHDDFEGEFGFDIVNFHKSLGELRKEELSLRRELSDLKSDQKVNDILSRLKEESALNLVKSFYKEGKITLEDYNKTSAAIKTEKGQVRYADVIVTTKNDEVLLLQRSLFDSSNPGAWVVPGGHVDKGETDEQAAKRELLEESGIAVDNLIGCKEKIAQFSPLGVYSDDKVHIAYYNLQIEDKTDIETLLQAEEVRDYLWVPNTDLINYPMVFNMRDNILKMMGWELTPQQKMIRKAYEQGVVGEEVFNKAMNHKYIRKEPDGKGGWNYIYEEKKEKISEKEEDIRKNINFTNLNKYTEEILNEERTIERLSPKEERGVRKGGSANVKATILCSAVEGTDGKDSVGERQEKILEDFAKEEGLWVNFYEEKKYWDFIASGGESRVYRDNDQFVKKVVDYSVFSETPLEYLDRLALHNHLFPSVYYELVGFTRTSEGFSFVVKQPMVKDVVNTPVEEIREEMSNMGFEDKGGVYISDDYIIDDAHSANVLKGKNGAHFFIDTVISLNTKGEGYGGKRKLGKFNFNDILVNKEEQSAIQKAYLLGLISDDVIEKAWKKQSVGTVVTRKDGKYRKVSETGNTKVDWVKVKGDVKQKQDEPNKDKVQKQDIQSAAKETSEAALQSAIKQSPDEEVRQAAHEELARRQKEEHIQADEKKGNKGSGDKNDKEKDEENKYVEKFRTLSDEQVKFYLDAPYPEVKEAAKLIADERGLKVVSKEDYIKEFKNYGEQTEEYHKRKNAFDKNFNSRIYDSLKTQAEADKYIKDIQAERGALENLEIASERERQKNVQRYIEEKKNIKDLNDDEIEYSLGFYQSLNGFKAIRNYLTDGSVTNTYVTKEKLDTRIGIISKFIENNPLKEDVALHRRVIAGGTFFKDLKEGDIYEDKSFSSTSLSGLSYFGDFNIKILAKKGSKVANIGNINESEYLIDKGSKFRVIEKHENGSGITVELL